MSDNNSERILLQDFAKMCGVTPTAVLDLVAAGDITADHVGNLVLLHRASAAHYLAHRPTT